MDRATISRLGEVIDAAQQAAQLSTLDSCDLDDIDDVIGLARSELQRPRPSARTLVTYLGSLARSLRAQPEARDACGQIEEVIILVQ